MAKLTAKDLHGLTAKQLQSVADDEQLGLRFNKSHTKAEMKRRILAAQARREADTFDVAAEAGRPAGESLDANPDFERLCDADSVTPIPPMDEPDGRGGARPGAGRPAGMTAEKAFYNNLSEQPHPAIKDALELLFDTWATAANCRGIALTEDEAMDIALPWTIVLEILGVAQKIPPWITVAITCAWNTLSIVKAKAKLARQATLERRREASEQAVNPC